MTCLYLELWKPRAAWTALPQSERDRFVAGIGPSIGALTEAGVELLGFALNDADTTCRADYGSHDGFEQVNARGAVLAPDTVPTWHEGGADGRAGSA